MRYQVAEKTHQRGELSLAFKIRGDKAWQSTFKLLDRRLNQFDFCRIVLFFGIKNLQKDETKTPIWVDIRL